MYTVKLITKDKIQCLGFKPDPHTVSLKDDGLWYALCDDALVLVLSLLCIRKQRNELYIGEVFTPKEFRRKGYFSHLLKYVVDCVYPEYSISTHALLASKKCFENAGFEEFSFRHFKCGDQWWLRRKGKKYVGEQIYN